MKDAKEIVLKFEKTSNGPFAVGDKVVLKKDAVIDHNTEGLWGKALTINALYFFQLMIEPSVPTGILLSFIETTRMGLASEFELCVSPEDKAENVKIWDEMAKKDEN
jgi:hypothetical protein